MIRMDIGGFFEFPSFDCTSSEESVYHYLASTNNNFELFRDGRQAIKAALSGMDIHDFKYIYLPSYLCYSIWQPFKELRLDVKFYSHERPLAPNLPGDIDKSLVFLIDYFGTEVIGRDKILEILEAGNSVILDITHSILDRERLKLPHENLYLISSLRKIFPVPDGGILYHKDPDLKITKRFPEGHENMVKAMTLKGLYLRGDVNEEERDELKTMFLDLYSEYEKQKDGSDIQIQSIPDVSLQILKNLKFEKILDTRMANLRSLCDFIDKELRLFNFQEFKSPFALPLAFESEGVRDQVKDALIRNDVYPPIHWNLDFLPVECDYEQELSKRILSIPIDQRYTSKDLNIVSKILNEVLA